MDGTTDGSFASAAADPFLSPIRHFDGVRRHPRPEDRLRAGRRAAVALREQMLAASPVTCFRSVALVAAPYPTRYALLDACALPFPFVHIENRLFVVQVQRGGERRTLLLSPTDIDRARETPYFARLRGMAGPLAPGLEKVIARRTATVEEQLVRLGVAPEDVDYISYDHLHTQDVRRWLGTRGAPGFFPRAKLLVMRQEWESTRGLLPTQADWYCPNGTDDVDPSRVVLLEGDTMVGDALALVRTPGHTEGNHSFVTRVDEGLFVTSENGVCVDAYAPRASKIPGVAQRARDTGAEVILNGNTLESSVEQYISMVIEKTIAGPSQRHADFPNMVVSSELAPFWGAPGISPTFRFGEIALGTYRSASTV